MDVKKEDVFEEIEKNEAPMSLTKEDNVEDAAIAFAPSTSVVGEEKIPLPFPPTDYNKHGKLKKVRGRVMKKLLKSEWRHYFPITAILMGLVLVVGVFYGLVLRKEMRLEQSGVYEYDHTTLFLSLMGALLFLLTMAGGIIFSQVYPVARYNKNFFQNEGYLTFSIPATAEEHIFAKRIGAVLCSLAMLGALALGGWFISLLSGVEDDSLLIEMELLLGVDRSSTGSVVLCTIEMIFSGLVGLFLLPAMYGAMSCILSKSAGKKKTFTILLLVFIGVGLLESLFSYLLVYGTSWLPTTKVGQHISTWITILLEAGLAVGCTTFEIWYLKNKLDLK